MKIVLVILFLVASLASAQTAPQRRMFTCDYDETTQAATNCRPVKVAEGFMISADQIQTTNEATKGEQPRKILFTCKHKADGNIIGGCALGEDVTLDELISEFVVRDTKRVKEHSEDALSLRAQRLKELKELKDSCQAKP